ncbi:protein ABIL3-like isoform X1 [Primulina tabacum]|uniref:protein ABIL3-like isoform X1 n=1 Tax=Primulina tabacum TaxID=48773 RepID=UPI003F5AC504
MDSHITGNAAPFSNSMDDISKQHSSQFASSLKDLKNLREQLYSAAEYFESSYVKENHKHFLVEGSKDYVARALVHTVDHFGSMADKLKKFLDEKANEFSDTNIRFSSIQQRLNTYQGFLDLRGLSKQSMIKHHKKYNIPGNYLRHFFSSPSTINPYFLYLDISLSLSCQIFFFGVQLQIMLYQPNQSFCTKIAVHVLNMTSTNKIKIFHSIKLFK